jgi:carboxypeptidase T
MVAVCGERTGSHNSDGSFGVDINRNYGFFWGYDDEGSSPIPYDDTYRGTEAIL